MVKPGQPPEFVYFPESGAVSIAACAPGDRLGHVGVYGYEGAGSAAALLGVTHSHFLEVVQFAGYAQRIAVRDLHDEMSACPELRSLLHSYAHILMTQIADTALANGSFRIDQRLARWVLMIQDRLRTSSIAVTHQRLSDLLGVRRSGVTDAVHLLEESRVIRARRGMIDVIDKRALQKLAAGCYGKPESAYERLILPPQVHDHEVLDQDRA
ncbi:MAG: Crp/Fnr family transcriptional regulator [Rhodomicrobiaceae bacterium]